MQQHSFNQSPKQAQQAPKQSQQAAKQAQQDPKQSHQAPKLSQQSSDVQPVFLQGDFFYFEHLATL